MRKISLENTNAAGKQTIKEINEKLILNLIREHQPISRAEIAEKTGLQRSTVTIITTRLLQDNWIYEGENGSVGVGRKPTHLYLNAKKSTCIGVQVGRRETLLALADLNGTLLEQKTLQTSLDAQRFFVQLARQISDMAALSPAGATVAGVGVSLPGYIEKARGRVIAAENFEWMDVPVGDWLRERLNVPVYFENNAKLSAFAEIWFGDNSTRHPQNFICVTSRDGIGTGIIINGEIYNGARDGAAEFGHVSLFPYGERCPCGNYGCWELYASDMATVKRYLRTRSGSRLTDSSDRELSVQDLVERAQKGERAARKALLTTGKYLGLGIANLVYGFNPELVIIGDSLKDAWEFIGDIVVSTVRSRVPGYYLEGLRILPSSKKQNPTLLGAIALVLAHHFTISRGL
ncbi:MAG: ROK family transcriptional regulator [Acidobacteriota bacterium]